MTHLLGLIDRVPIMVNVNDISGLPGFICSNIVYLVIKFTMFI